MLAREATYRVTDVTKPEDNQKPVDIAKEKFGKVDVIFLYAGIMSNSPFSVLKVEE